MNSNKEAILSRVRAALTPLPKRATLPNWDIELAEAKKLVGERPAPVVFAERIKLFSGRSFESAAEIASELQAGGWTKGYCDPKLWPLFKEAFAAKGIEAVFEYDRTRVDDYHFGITAARAGIAETGTLILDDASTSRRLAALAPWVHIAVLAKKDIHTFLADAVSTLGKDPNIIFATGPSRTADVEGILIEGVHGPGKQWALLV